MNRRDDDTRVAYDQKYAGEDYYWTLRPSSSCFEVLKRMPPDRPLRLLDVGCGEGRNAVFFARNGYHVTAFDLSPEGVKKTRDLADKVGVPIDAFEADLNVFRVSEPFDILFSTGVLHSSAPSVRDEMFSNYQRHTREGGLHVISVFVAKPFIPPAPDRDPNASPWRSGELLRQYADWRIEWCVEEIFDCRSSGVPHQHAVNRLAARKPASGDSTPLHRP
jgi:tellurite methyltransferase